jgi:hypothetical protein
MNEISALNYGKIVRRVLELIILKPLILPLKIYKNTLINLSNSDSGDSSEQVLASEFPLYVWFIDLFDAIIALCYPLGLIAALSMATDSYFGGLSVFITTCLIAYFLPLIYGFIKEILSITLKSIKYLKLLSNK